MSDVKRPIARPLSPHLQVYAWKPNMIVSTLHRLTGVALTAGTLLLTWGLVALATGPEAYGIFSGFLGGVIGQLILVGYTWALLQHLMSGLRHLYMDTGAGLEIHGNQKSAIGTLVLSAALTVAVWAFALSAL